MGEKRRRETGAAPEGGWGYVVVFGVAFGFVRPQNIVIMDIILPKRNY